MNVIGLDEIHNILKNHVEENGKFTPGEVIPYSLKAAIQSLINYGIITEIPNANKVNDWIENYDVTKEGL